MTLVKFNIECCKIYIKETYLEDIEIDNIIVDCSGISVAHLIKNEIPSLDRITHHTIMRISSFELSYYYLQYLNMITA